MEAGPVFLLIRFAWVREITELVRLLGFGNGEDRTDVAWNESHGGLEAWMEGMHVDSTKGTDAEVPTQGYRSNP